MLTNLETLKARIDVVDVIANSLELKKSGANFKACCPFHGEDTPSLVVSPQKQIWHCFGCGAGGDAIKFVEEYKKISFIEACEDIANDLNFTLEYDENAQTKDYKILMESINTFYQENLVQDKLAYLQQRGISLESIKTFELGYSSSSDKQKENLAQKFLYEGDAQEVGILAQDGYKVYARLTDRITFPIRNHTNKLIGFGGRILQGERAKYLNSPQTKLFDKSRNLYGYNIAKEHVYKKGTIVITEGYLDVIMLHQAGIKTAVATMGTALTKEHCLTIQKASVKALLCFDGDKAGKNASFKASKLLSEFGIDGGVILFDDGVDPADMIKDHREEELYSIMKKPIPLIKYALNFISSSYAIKNPHEKNKALQESLAFLKTLNPVIASEYKTYLSEILHIEEELINFAQNPYGVPTQEQKPKGEFDFTELSIITTAMKDDYFFDLITTTLTSSMFKTHSKEFDTLVSKKDVHSLWWMFLKDGVVTYQEEELKHQLCVFLVDYSIDKLQKIKKSSMDSISKTTQIKSIQKNIIKLKRGELAS